MGQALGVESTWAFLRSSLSLSTKINREMPQLPRLFVATPATSGLVTTVASGHVASNEKEVIVFMAFDRNDRGSATATSLGSSQQRS